MSNDKKSFFIERNELEMRRMNLVRVGNPNGLTKLILDSPQDTVNVLNFMIMPGDSYAHTNGDAFEASRKCYKNPKNYLLLNHPMTMATSQIKSYR